VSEPEPKAPPGPLVLSGVADAVDSQLWHFTVTNVQGNYLTCYWGDVSESSVPIPTPPMDVQLDHRFAAAGTYTVTAHSAAGNQNDVTLTVTVTTSTYVPPVETPPGFDPLTVPWRPSVDDVAALLRARTKDASGNELGTFTSETRPTDAEVEQLITNGMGKVASRVGWELPEQTWEEARHLASLVAACEVEVSYRPEEVRTERSAYQQLWAMFTYDIDPFAEMVGSLQPGGLAPGPETLKTPSGTVNWAYTYGFGVPPVDEIANV